MHPFQWWYDRLQNIRPVGDGFTALCPAHDDHSNSFSIRELPDGSTLVHCFKECSYSDILLALENLGEHVPEEREIPAVTQKLLDRSVRLFWEEYTQVPSALWELWGVSFQQDSICFTWASSPSKKKRILKGEGKQLFWVPEGAPRPPLWPELPVYPLESIWVTEGESDCGIARYLGYEAFGLTKGAASLEHLEPVWRSLRDRGVKKITFCLDFDEEGLKRVSHLSNSSLARQLQVEYVDFSKLISPLLGEKDLRDLWIRLRDQTKLRDQLEKSIVQVGRPYDQSRPALQTFLSQTIPGAQWVVEDILLSQTVNLIVGSPKIGKSWLALDLGLSIATKKPFLNHFRVNTQGPVLYISKEDPAYALQDRLSKIMCGKGLGGSFIETSHTGTVKFPSTFPIHFYSDLSRGFLFSKENVSELIDWLQEKKEELGHIALVIFDPILKMMPAGLDEFRATDVNQAVFEPAFQIVNSLGTSVLVVHHKSKAGGRGAYGSIAFHAFADSTLYLTEEKDDWLAVEGEFKSAPSNKWRCHFLDLNETYKVEVSTSIVARADILDQDLVAYLRKHQGTLITDLDKYFKEIELFALREALKSLEGKNILYREKEKEKAPGTRGGPRRDLWYVKD